MIRLYRFLRPFRVVIAAILVLVLLQSLSDLYLPTLMADIVDNGIRNKDISYMMRTGGIIAGQPLTAKMMKRILSSKGLGEEPLK